METRDLQTFLAVAASGSITKAAELLRRPQPSVTRTIQDLEAELGFQLLHRVGGMVVTDDRVPILHQPPGNIGPHAAQPNHRNRHTISRTNRACPPTPGRT